MRISEGPTHYPAVWVVDKEAWSETIPAGVIPIAWARAMQALIVMKEAVPLVSKVI